MATYGYFEGRKTQLYLSKLGPSSQRVPKSPELRLHKMVPLTSWILITISPSQKGSVLPDVAWFLTPQKKKQVEFEVFYTAKNRWLMMVIDVTSTRGKKSVPFRATKLLGTPASCAQDRPMTSRLTSKPRNTTRGHDLVHVYIYICYDILYIVCQFIIYSIILLYIVTVYYSVYI